MKKRILIAAMLLLSTIAFTQTKTRYIIAEYGQFETLDVPANDTFYLSRMIETQDYIIYTFAEEGETERQPLLVRDILGAWVLPSGAEKTMLTLFSPDIYAIKDGQKVFPFSVLESLSKVTDTSTMNVMQPLLELLAEYYTK